ncbi:MAG: Uma2 family endonuclease [Dysgonamonadaceae bacterium]|jgi:Uma2 family endonuclease|nr:Uma2 family endonuclease [Dysgonamonadaceae bacterium]
MELALDAAKRYSYADYLTWFDEKRRELYNGFIKLMSPAPVLSHATVVGNIYADMRQYIRLNKGKCKLFVAPFDVRLPVNGETDDDKIYTVVQPDVCLVCDLSKLDERGCLGAPDLVVEVLSPSTRKNDLNDKYLLYEKAGVKEYWVIAPSKDKDVTVFLLQDDGKYAPGQFYDEHSLIPVKSLPGLEIRAEELFN